MEDCANLTSLGFVINGASRALRRRFERRAAELGVSAAQWRLLLALKRAGPLPQARLAELLEVEPISLSRLVNRTEQAGWTARAPAPEDRRVRVVDLTDRARDAFADMRRVAEEIYEDALRGLAAEDIETTRSVLIRIMQNLAEPTGNEDHDE